MLYIDNFNIQVHNVISQSGVRKEVLVSVGNTFWCVLALSLTATALLIIYLRRKE